LCSQNVVLFRNAPPYHLQKLGIQYSFHYFERTNFVMNNCFDVKQADLLGHYFLLLHSARDGDLFKDRAPREYSFKMLGVPAVCNYSGICKCSTRSLGLLILPCSQGPSTSPYQPDQSSPYYPYPVSLSSILILSTHPHLGLLSDLVPSGFPTNNQHVFLLSPFVLHALLTSSFWT
jgi:hypothetical protein